jgi:hypothetical protein
MDDVNELYRNNKFLKFVPKYEMTRTEQLNAITRFLIYFMILLLLFNKADGWLYIPITGIVIVTIFYNVHKGDDKGREKELDRILRIRKEQRYIDQEELKKELRHDGDEHFKLDIDEIKPDYDLEVGNIDSEGTMIIGPKLDRPSGITKQDNLYTIDELIDYQKNTCRRPTRENPFMNPDLTDYNNPNTPPAACNVDDDQINDEMRVNFNQDLFQDIDNLFERANSQRQFYSIPNTAVPNNQEEFAKWCWLVPEERICKGNGEACLRVVDLRNEPR